MVRTELCSVCSAETGRAGRADDSLYLETPSGNEVGPLCKDCFGALRRDDLSDEIDALRARVAELEGLLSHVEQEVCSRCGYMRSIGAPCKCGQFVVRGTNQRLSARVAELEAVVNVVAHVATAEPSAGNHAALRRAYLRYIDALAAGKE